MKRVSLCTTLALLASPAAAQNYRHPVVGDAVITAYYDLDSGGGRRDWNCGANTYNGHRGTDIGIIGRFAAQDAGRDVVAGAPGRVTRSHDGEFDRCTTGECGGGGGFGNHVAIEHPDGKVTYYAHLRNGSVAVRVGDQVQCGQRLGQVGSSGNSTGPHLHFEVRVGGTADDPYTGPCGGPLTYWVEQGAYNGLPAARCADGAPVEPPPPPPPPPEPDFHLALNLVGPEGRACDFPGTDCFDVIRDGRSAGVPDAWMGDAVRVEVVVSNRGAGATAAESPEDAAIELQWSLPGAVRPTGYLIETDHPGRDQQVWQRNDAMDNPANPAPEAVGSEQVLRLNGFSPGESKRVTVWVQGWSRTLPGGPAPLHFWVRHVRNYYGERTGWDDAVEANRGQTFNGGDLRVERHLDVFDPKRFEFDAEDGGLLEGWRRCDPSSVGTLGLVDGALQAEVTGSSPCLESPPLAVPRAEVGGVRLRVAHHGGPRGGRLQWSDAPDDAERPFTPVDSVAFSTQGTGAYEDLHLGLPSPGAGPLRRLRLWLALAPEGAEPAEALAAGPLRLDAVALVPEAPPPVAPDAGPTPRDAGAEDGAPRPPDPDLDDDVGPSGDAGAGGRADRGPAGSRTDLGSSGGPEGPDAGVALQGGCATRPPAGGAAAGAGAANGGVLGGGLLLGLLGLSRRRRRRQVETDPRRRVR